MGGNAEELYYSGADKNVIGYISILIKSLRPEQYYKNLLVFVGLIFTYRIFSDNLWAYSVMAFIIYCMLSGSNYILNDIFDMEKDKNHPVKSLRPIASRRLNIFAAGAFAAGLIAISIILSYAISLNFMVLSIALVLSNISYDLITKNIPFLDAISISINFIIRVIAGCLAIGSGIPLWITSCIFILSLLLVFGKRRSTLVILGDEAKNFKGSLLAYNVKMLDKLINALSIALVALYLVYTYHSGNIYIALTVPPVIYGILRYLFLLRSRNMGEVADILLKDGRFVACMAIWLCLNTIVLYS